MLVAQVGLGLVCQLQLGTDTGALAILITDFTLVFALDAAFTAKDFNFAFSTNQGRIDGFVTGFIRFTDLADTTFQLPIIQLGRQA